MKEDGFFSFLKRNEIKGMIHVSLSSEVKFVQSSNIDKDT